MRCTNALFFGFRFFTVRFMEKISQFCGIRFLIYLRKATKTNSLGTFHVVNLLISFQLMPRQ